jgi:hypothetical protein
MVSPFLSPRFQMISDVRKKYNASFTDAKYQAFLQALYKPYNYEIEFRVAETPVFIPKALKHHVLQACREIIEVIKRPDFKELTKNAVPPHLNVPNEDAHTQCLAIDFAICQDKETGELIPQLIELQGFPSLYCFQQFVSATYKEYFDIPENFDYLFSGLTPETYLDLLRRTFIGKHAVENVILLEVEPEKQKTKVDFYCTQDFLGIKYVCLTEVIREGRQLFYMRDGVKTPIKRIYNRVIFDELSQRTDLKLQFNLLEDVDVEWAGHPNWFFRISKYTLPWLKSRYVPETRFLSDFTEYPKDLENYVLKPLFSFAGAGVIFNVQQSDIDAVADKENYILMKKVEYAPALQSPDGAIKTELRMLIVWPEEDESPTIATNLVRLGRADLMGVRFNKDKTWVGGSTAFFEKD